MKNRTNTVAFANLIGSIVFLVIGIWAWIQTTQFQTVKDTYVQPATFPQIMIVGLLIFSAALLIQSVWKLLKMSDSDPYAEKAPSIHVLKDKGVQAALIVIALCVAYVALFKPLGYVLVSAIVCFAIMYLIGKRHYVVMALVSVLVPLGMWLLFYILLKVNIPMGPLTFLRDLVDMIF